MCSVPEGHRYTTALLNNYHRSRYIRTREGNKATCDIVLFRYGDVEFILSTCDQEVFHLSGHAGCSVISPKTVKALIPY